MKSSAKALQKDQSGTRNTGYISNAPASGTHASNLIGAKVITAGDEEVGSVNDLVIDRDGQVVRVVIGVGGFLGMGENDVAIAWDDIQRSGKAKKLELRISPVKA